MGRKLLALLVFAAIVGIPLYLVRTNGKSSSKPKEITQKKLVIRKDLCVIDGIAYTTSIARFDHDQFYVYYWQSQFQKEVIHSLTGEEVDTAKARLSFEQIGERLAGAASEIDEMEGDSSISRSLVEFLRSQLEDMQRDTVEIDRSAEEVFPLGLEDGKE